MAKETKKFDVHVRKKNNLRGWLSFFLLVGPPAAIVGYAYWFQLDATRQIECVRARDPRAPFAAWSLGRQKKAAEVRPELQEIILDTSTSPWLRRGAASALGTLHDPLVTAFLSQAALADPDASVRAQACDALGVNGERNAMATLSQVLADEVQPDAIAEACGAVGDLQLFDLIPQLIERMSTSDYRVRTAAREALETFAPEGTAFGDNPERWLDWYEGR